MGTVTWSDRTARYFFASSSHLSGWPLRLAWHPDKTRPGSNRLVDSGRCVTGAADWWSQALWPTELERLGSHRCMVTLLERRIIVRRVVIGIAAAAPLLPLLATPGEPGGLGGGRLAIVV